MTVLEIHALNGETDIDPTPARKLIEHGRLLRRKEDLKGAEEGESVSRSGC